MKLACAYAALVPLVSLIVTLDAAHPALATFVPRPVAIGAVAILGALLALLAVRELATYRAIAPMYRTGLIFAGVVLLASVLGFEPLPGIIAALVFGALSLAGDATLRAAEAGGWRPIVEAFLWSGIVLCTLALFALALREPPELYAFAHGRAIGIFENPNELALYTLALCATAAGAALADVRLRLLGSSALGLGTLTLVATGSRSGEVAYAIGAVLVLLSLRARRGIAVAALAVAILGIGLAFALDRRHNPAENDARIAAWRAGIRTVERFPLLGVGVGAYYRVYPLVRGPDSPGPDDPIAFDPHDFYLSVAAETGLAGLVAFGACILVFARQLREALAGASPPAQRFSLALVAGLVAMASHLVFNGFALSIGLWSVLAALAVGVPRSGYGRAP